MYKKDLIVISDFQAKIHVLIEAHRMRSALHSLFASSPHPIHSVYSRRALVQFTFFGHSLNDISNVKSALQRK